MVLVGGRLIALGCWGRFPSGRGIRGGSAGLGGAGAGHRGLRSGAGGGASGGAAGFGGAGREQRGWRRQSGSLGHSRRRGRSAAGRLGLSRWLRVGTWLASSGVRAEVGLGFGFLLRKVVVNQAAIELTYGFVGSVLVLDVVSAQLFPVPGAEGSAVGQLEAGPVSVLAEVGMQVAGDVVVAILVSGVFSNPVHHSRLAQARVRAARSSRAGMSSLGLAALARSGIAVSPEAVCRAFGAGGGSRTRVASLEGWGMAALLYSHSFVGNDYMLPGLPSAWWRRLGLAGVSGWLSASALLELKPAVVGLGNGKLLAAARAGSILCGAGVPGFGPGALAAEQAAAVWTFLEVDQWLFWHELLRPLIVGLAQAGRGWIALGLNSFS